MEGSIEEARGVFTLRPSNRWQPVSDGRVRYARRSSYRMWQLTTDLNGHPHAQGDGDDEAGEENHRRRRVWRQVRPSRAGDGEGGMAGSHGLTILHRLAAYEAA